ncbi:MAG: phosphoglycolate phosphatase [Methanomicrobiales archaeon]|nr:phosphoglycolate phosphatase [Methanomicrobiales archaeon]
MFLRALACDLDGTLTGPDRRISLPAMDCLRGLIRTGVLVIPASGNTVCFMDAFARMLGSDGTLIAENGGAYRIGFTGPVRVFGERSLAWDAFHTVERHFAGKGKALELYSPNYRFSDVAFARTVPVEEVRSALEGIAVQVIDTGFAIHLQSTGISKGKALRALAGELGLPLEQVMAVGDSVNDLEMIQVAGIGATVANGHPSVRAAADMVAEKKYGDGFLEAVRRYLPYFLER